MSDENAAYEVRTPLWGDSNAKTYSLAIGEAHEGPGRKPGAIYRIEGPNTEAGRDLVLVAAKNLAHWASNWVDYSERECAIVSEEDRERGLRLIVTARGKREGWMKV